MTIHIPAWVEGALAPVEKLEVHQKGLRHKAVSVFVMAGDQLLIQRRALCKYHTPGLWANTCCTHPEWDEDPLDCAVRRLNEELGIVGLVPKLRGQIEYRADVANGLIEHELVDVFLVESATDLAMNPNPDEVMDTRWVSFAELDQGLQSQPKAYTPWLQIYMQDHSRQIFGDLITA